MGNLHDGHLALVEKARTHADCVVVSIFVNPLQFLPSEDFNQYPRTLSMDCEQLHKLEVDFVFTPDEKILFPAQQEFLLLLPSIAEQFEGAFRPGFFRGVATIVLKLFNIVQPDIAIFGKKDYQQLHIIRRMVQQLNLPVDILDEETVRAHDGLALSSRNQYLDELQRIEASHLYHSLNMIKKDIEMGQDNFALLEKKAMDYLETRGWSVDYIAILERYLLSRAKTTDKALVVLVAARIGKTRLIDNIEILRH